MPSEPPPPDAPEQAPTAWDPERAAQRERLIESLKEQLRVQSDELGRAHDLLEQVAEQRARAQQGMADHSERFRSVVAAMAEGVAVHDADGAILFANASAWEILGLTEDQLLGREAVDPRWALTDEQGKPLAQEAIPSEITRATGQACRNVVLGVRRPSGARAYLRVSTEPLANGQVVATFADFTREHDALEQLEQQRAELQRIADAMPGVMWQIFVPSDGPMHVRYVSARAEPLLGLSPKALMRDGAVLLDRLTREDGEAAVRSLRDPGLTLWEQDLRLRLEDGETRSFRAHALPQPTPSGTLWSGVLLDVTDERRLAEQLRHSQRREAMGDLAAGIAHNFNNMLGSIIPNLQEALTNADERGSAPLKDALRVARDGAEVVRQLLLTARAEAQQKRVPVDVERVVADIAGLCRRSFKQEVEIITELPGSGATVLARTGQLQQVLLNMCINAHHALRGRSAPRLWLVVERGDDSAVVRIRDNGHGMSEQTRKRVGEPFFTTKPAGEGTGLGVATAYAIVEELAGHVSCESTLDIGTEFSIHLPATFADDAIHTTLTPRSESGFAGERVLVVDDEALLRRAVKRRLERQGLEVATAGGGAEAIEVVKSWPEPPAAVLMDLSMPGMNGLDAMAELHRMHPELPVLIMTGHVPDGISLDAAASVLVKPAEESVLVAALRAAIRG